MSSDIHTNQSVPSIATVYSQLQPTSHKRSCKYCHGMIAGSHSVHEECRSDFEWEQNMKLLNAHWRPAVSTDYLETV